VRSFFLCCSILFCLAGFAEPVRVGLFTDANRQVFAQGEEIEVSVLTAGAAGEVAVTLTGPNLALPLFTAPVTAARAVTTVRLRPELTAVLRPGAYALTAVLGPHVSLPLPLNMVETLRATHLTIVNDDHAACPEGNLALVSGFSVDDPNAWSENVYHLTAETRARAPEEWSLPRFGTELAAETALAGGECQVVRPHWGWARTLRLGLGRNLRDYDHGYAVAVQRLKRFPSFAGLSYGDEIHPLGDWRGGTAGAPYADPDFALRMKLYIDEVAARRPELKITRDTLLPEKPQLWRGWTSYINDLVPAAATRWHALLSGQMTNFVTTHTGALPTVCEPAAGRYPPTLFRAMTAIQGRADAGPLAEELGADTLLLGRRGQPAWVGSRERLTRPRALRLLARGVDGLGATTDDLPLRLGDLCLGLVPDREVALLYSYTEAIFDLDVPAWRASLRTPDDHANPELAALNQRDAVASAYGVLRRFGYQVRLVSEEDIRDGGLAGYRQLYVVGLTHTLPSAVLDRIGEFQASGGKVYQDDDTTVPVPDVETLHLSFAAAGHAAWVQRMKAQRAPLADAPSVDTLFFTAGQPLLQALTGNGEAPNPDPRVLRTTARWGGAEYHFITADVPGGTPPVAAVPAGCVYDLIAHRRVTTATLPVGDGLLLARLPAPVTGVEVKFAGTVMPGTRMPLTVRVLGARDALVPVEIEVRDPRGQRRWHLFRAAAGADGLRETLPVAVNDDPGTWTVRATELCSGISAQKAFSVVGMRITADPRYVFRVPEVAVSGLEALRARLRPGAEVLVLLDDGQEAYRPLAQGLAARLTAAGLRSSVVTPKDVALPAAGYPLRPERAFTDDLPDLPRHVVLLSGARPGVLYGKLARHGAVTRGLTPNFPGPGRGLIDYHWSPFTGGYDAISLVANDDAGLQKAAALFRTLLDGDTPPEVAACGTLAQNLEHVRTLLLPPRVAWRPAPATWEPPENSLAEVPR
jgi:hypothetical protein